MKKIILILYVVITVHLSSGKCISDEISYQGRITQNDEVGGLFAGINGFFKFAIVDSTGKTTHWSNDLSSTEGGEPNTSVLVPFPEKNGVFQVSLGGVQMNPLDPSVFNQAETYLRIWFSPDGEEFDLLSPDEKISTVAYSFHSRVAETVVDGSLGLSKLSNDFSGMTVVSGDANDLKLKAMGFARFGQISSQPWILANPDGEPDPVLGHSSVSISSTLDGIVMIVWGGSPVDGFYSDMGWAYDSNADRWSQISPVDAPSPRSNHTGVAHGDQMVIWGGLGPQGDGSEVKHLNDGGIYSLTKNKWTRISPNNKVVTARRGHTASVMSNKMLVWGGRNEFNIIGDGGVYDFEENKWETVSGQNPPSARARHTASVFEDRLVIIWGGESDGGFLQDGFAYNVENGVWAKLTSETEGPQARAGHTAIMVNGQLVIWGGVGKNGLIGDGYIFSFNPESTNFVEQGKEVSGKWSKLPSLGQPSPRIGHSVEWTGSEMIIYGGETDLGETNTGHAYDTMKKMWRSLTTKGGAIPRTLHTSEWTGSQLIIFGGIANRIRKSNTQILDPQGTWHLYRKL